MILAILQARMSSSRLPGKALMPLAGAPMLVRQIERVHRARRIDALMVATSDDPSDDPLAKAARREGVAVFRGPLDDVQARFLGALDEHDQGGREQGGRAADHLVRLTGDCPLADPDVIDATIERVLAAGADYGSNTPPHRTYPKGLDVEVMTVTAFRAAAARATTPEEHEHVTWLLHRRPDLFRQVFLSQGPEEGEVRWTVDFPHDYAFVAAVYDALYPANKAFTSDDVRALVRARADLAHYGGERRV